VIEVNFCGRLLQILIPALLLTGLSGCGGDMDDLAMYINEVKARQGGRIEPLPQIKPYETFTYNSESKRSPFLPDSKILNPGPTGPKPIINRNKEYLEQFPLDTLAMVGTLETEGDNFGLVQTKDGLVHRVLPGNYIGQNDGRITAISDAEIEVEELVSNGIGNFFKRSAAIGLD
jgi:type IV pilus assembly protein PilP